MTATQSEIRAWAQANGVPCSAKGNIGAATKAAYAEAHGIAAGTLTTSSKATASATEPDADLRIWPGDLVQITYQAQLTEELIDDVTVLARAYLDEDDNLAVGGVRLYDDAGDWAVQDPRVILQREPAFERGDAVYITARVKASTRDTVTGEYIYALEVMETSGGTLTAAEEALTAIPDDDEDAE